MQGRDRHDTETGAESEPLRHAGGEPDPRETAGAAREGERIKFAERETRRREQFIDHRQQQFGVAARRLDIALEPLGAVARQQRHRAGFR